MAGALGLHVGLGWGLGWGAAGDGSVARRAEATLVWLDGAPGAGPEASAPVVAAPVVAASAAARPVARGKVGPRARAALAAPAAAEDAAEKAGGSGGSGGSAGSGDSAGSAGLDGGGARQAQVPSLGRSAPAHLLATSDPCADLFPYAARSDSGTVAVALDVATNGQPRESHIVEEAPRGQGFALAAHYCVRRLRFSPAVDAEGHAVASRSVVRLRFARRVL